MSWGISLLCTASSLFATALASDQIMKPGTHPSVPYHVSEWKAENKPLPVYYAFVNRPEYNNQYYQAVMYDAETHEELQYRYVLPDDIPDVLVLDKSDEQ